MDSKTLDSIINEDEDEIIFEQYVKKVPGIEFIEKIEPVDYIGRPISNPYLPRFEGLPTSPCSSPIVFLFFCFPIFNLLL